MHILYAFPEPLPLPGKARAIQVIKTVDALGKLGVRVTLAYVRDLGLSECPFEAYGMEMPPNVTLLPISMRIPILGVKSGLMFVRRLRQWLKQQVGAVDRPTLLFVRHVKFADRWLQAGWDLPLVYEAHEVFADTAPAQKQAAMAKMEAKVLCRATKVLAITRQLADVLRERYGLTQAMPILPSATDLPERVPAKQWSQRCQHIVYAGSLYGWKGVDDLVDAAQFLPPETTVTIIGGDRESISRLQARQMLGGAQIHYLGQMPHSEVMAHLATACIAVLPNRAGSVSAFTSPLKLFEYMASGCALVVSDLPVFREVLPDAVASWFQAGDARALAGALQRCLDDEGFCRQSAEQLAMLAQGYSWQSRALALHGYCQDVMNGCT